MNDEVLHHLRTALVKLKLGKPTRETALTITKVDEAILWRQQDLQVNAPPINERGTTHDFKI